MTSITAEISVNLSRLKRFEGAIDAGLRGNASGTINKVLKQWAARYRSYVQERFDKFSKGGGNWKRLAPSTLARRRKGNSKKGRKQGKNRAGGTVARYNKAGRQVDKRGRFVVAVKASILRDLGILYAALSPVFHGAPGALEQKIPYGVRVGFGGTHHYPDSGVSISDIAAFHNSGDGVPKRQIIVQPTLGLMQQMADDMQRGLDKLSREIQ